MSDTFFYPFRATLFNQVRENNEVTYYKTFLYVMDWQQEQGIKTLKTSNTAVDVKSNIVLYIPYDTTSEAEYVSPKVYARLVSKEGYWTLATHDKIVKGFIDDDITTEKQYRELSSYYDDVATITSVTDCEMMKHFEVRCA